MSSLGDMLNKVLGRKPEAEKPKQEPPKEQPQQSEPKAAKPAEFRINENVPQHKGPGTSPTDRFLNNFPDVKETAKQVYDGQKPPSPGPLAEKEKEPTKKEHKFMPPGVHSGPTTGGMGMGTGGGRSAPTPSGPKESTPTPTPAPTPPKKPPVKTFEQFIGADKPHRPKV